MFSFWGRGGLSPFRILAWLFLVCLLISFSYAASTGPWSTPQERQQAEQNVEVMLVRTQKRSLSIGAGHR
jgi:hypothetical protein